MPPSDVSENLKDPSEELASSKDQPIDLNDQNLKIRQALKTSPI